MLEFLTLSAICLRLISNFLSCVKMPDILCLNILRSGMITDIYFYMLCLPEHFRVVYH